MADFFKKAATDVNNLQKEFLGQNYEYHRFIRQPGEMGMSGAGTMRALNNDVAGIINYVHILVSGKGRASKIGRPLGDKFFLKTGGQCRDIKSKKLVPRSMYINNVPSGVVNFIPAMPNVNVGDSFKGLIPGIFNDLGSINPVAMFGSFMQSSEPPCASVTLPTVDENSVTKKGTGFVPINELKQLQSEGALPKNTVTKQMLKHLNDSSTTKETFLNMCLNRLDDVDKPILKEEDNFQTLYYTSLAMLVVYLLYRSITRN